MFSLGKPLTGVRSAEVLGLQGRLTLIKVTLPEWTVLCDDVENVKTGKSCKVKK